MSHRPDPTSAAAVLVSWTFAIAGGALALLLATLGQAIGAVIGGCHWIGLTLPIDRQPWALVNQPSLAFSAQGAALGYWLGGLVLCLLVAVLAIGFVPRPRTLSWELAVIHAAWGAAFVGLAWLPLVEPRDGHLSGLLRVHELPPVLVWIAPVIAGWAALVPAGRLLALARTAVPAMPRWKRVLTIVAHQGVPAFLWVAVGLTLIATRGETSATGLAITRPLVERLWPPAVAAAMPVVAALLLAWTSIPRPSVGRLDVLRPANLLPPLLVLVPLACLILVLGRPLPAGRCSGLLWGAPDSRNNIRQWVDPVVVGSARTGHR
jgi:hypothetical protein